MANVNDIFTAYYYDPHAKPIATSIPDTNDNNKKKDDIIVYHDPSESIYKNMQIFVSNELPKVQQPTGDGDQESTIKTAGIFCPNINLINGTGEKFVSPENILYCKIDIENLLPTIRLILSYEENQNNYFSRFDKVSLLNTDDTGMPYLSQTPHIKVCIVSPPTNEEGHSPHKPMKFYFKVTNVSQCASLVVKNINNNYTYELIGEYDIFGFSNALSDTKIYGELGFACTEENCQQYITAVKKIEQSNLPPVLKRGSKDKKHVSLVQQFLFKNGYLNDGNNKSTNIIYTRRGKGRHAKKIKRTTPNGFFCSVTEDAVKEWQKKVNITADGKIGKQSWPIILEAMAQSDDEYGKLAKQYYQSAMAHTIDVDYAAGSKQDGIQTITSETTGRETQATNNGSINNGSILSSEQLLDISVPKTVYDLTGRSISMTGINATHPLANGLYTYTNKDNSQVSYTAIRNDQNIDDFSITYIVSTEHDPIMFQDQNSTSLSDNKNGNQDKTEANLNPARTPETPNNIINVNTSNQSNQSNQIIIDNTINILLSNITSLSNNLKDLLANNKNKLPTLNTNNGKPGTITAIQKYKSNQNYKYTPDCIKQCITIIKNILDVSLLLSEEAKNENSDVYGPALKNCVKTFQTTRLNFTDKAVDGVVGPLTWDAIKKYLENKIIQLQQVQGVSSDTNNAAATNTNITNTNTNTIQTQLEDPKAPNKLNTWAALHAIAKEYGFGFGATPDVISIQDFANSRVTPIKLVDYIKYKMNHGGTNNVEILDIWFDEYCTLNICNIGKLLFNNYYMVNLDNLTMTINTTPFTEDNMPLAVYKECPRLLTNYEKITQNLIKLDKNTNFDVTQLTISHYQDGFTDVPSAPIQEQILIEETGDVPAERQTNGGYTTINTESTNSTQHQSTLSSNNPQVIIIRNTNPNYNPDLQFEFKRKAIDNIHYRHKLIVRLGQINYSLHRGQMIGVMLFSKSPSKTQEVIGQLKRMGINLDPTYFLSGNESNQLPLFDLSGVYYINKVMYIYDPRGTYMNIFGEDDELKREHDVDTNKINKIVNSIHMYLELIPQKTYDSNDATFKNSSIFKGYIDILKQAQKDQEAAAKEREKQNQTQQEQQTQTENKETPNTAYYYDPVLAQQEKNDKPK